jgi:uncharacterized protein DUF6502
MEFDEFEGVSKSKRIDVRVVARKALLQLFEPLAGFILDAGLSTNELHRIMRHAAVRSVAARQLEASHRINISGIAATTGIPRAEISRILKLSTMPDEHPRDRQQKSTNRILAAWHEVPKFTNSNGHPADLRLYGRGATFESLVRSHGSGIPTRAVLDELLRARAVEVLPSQRIRARATMAVDRGMSPQVVKAFGDRATELLNTMLLNMREPESAQFIASVSGSTVIPHSLPLFRKELSNKGAAFLADIQESLTQEPGKRSAKSSTVSVTVFCHESIHQKGDKKKSSNKRRNFRRNP